MLWAVGSVATGKGRGQTRGQVTQEEKCAAAVDVGRPCIAPTEKEVRCHQ